MVATDLTNSASCLSCILMNTITQEIEQEIYKMYCEHCDNITEKNDDLDFLIMSISMIQHPGNYCKDYVQAANYVINKANIYCNTSTLKTCNE